MKKHALGLLMVLLLTALTVLGPAAAVADEGLEIQLMAALYSPVDMENAFWTTLQEKLDTKLNIEWVPSTEYETKMELLLASGDIPEMMSVEGATNLNLLRAINEGYFWDVREYVGDFSRYPNMAANIPEMAWKYLSNNGGYYRIPRPRAYINVCPLVREDWFAKAGYTDLSKMTLDDLTNALETICKGDYDGNGVDDTIGIHFFEEIGQAFGVQDLKLDEAGKLWPYQLTDEYADMVAWYADLYAKGCMSPEFAVITDGQYDEMMKTGRLALKHKNTWHCYTLSEEAKKVQPEAAVRPLTVITNGDYVNCRFDPGFVGAVLISKKVPEEKMLKMLAYIDKTLDKDFATYISYGTQGVHHEVVDGERVLTEKGALEVNNSANIPFAIYCSEWFKVDSPVAPKAFNDMMHERVQIMYEYGRANPWQILRSDTWSAEWPMYNEDFVAMRTKAISGLITMDEFRAYQQSLREMDFVKLAADEFTASRAEFYPDGNTKLGK